MLSLKTTRTETFTSKVANPEVHGKNILYLRKGSTCIGNRWVHFKDQTINVDNLIREFIFGNRKLFKKINDVRYVLIVLDQYGKVNVLKSIEEQVNEDAEIKVFEDLSNVAPLVLVKITQDGTSGLTGIKELSENDLEVYNGYGNFTIRGEPGPLGHKGETGYQGLTGNQGETGFRGVVGERGVAGVQGVTGTDTPGITGIRGRPGSC